MKTLFMTIMLAFIALPALADSGHKHAAESWLRKVEAKHVCMSNDKVFEGEQMSFEVEGKTYYGCCPMCKEILQKDAARRKDIDPVSGKEVDKASAVIGADASGKTYYFENEENMLKFASGPIPAAGETGEAKTGEHAEGEKGHVH